MTLKRRLIFHGNAAAFGGRIVRPADVVFEMPGASALPVTGGRSVSRIGRTRFEKFLSFESASTLAEGLFDDRAGAIALSHHEVREDSLTASTRVFAEVRRLVVGTEQRLKAVRLAAELRSKNPGTSGEPRITVGDVAADGVTIDGFKLTVALDRTPFERYDTHAKLLTALDDPGFVRKFGRHLLLEGSARTGRAAPTGHGTSDTIYGTLVSSIEWAGRKNPDADIIGHTVVVKNLGTLFFGELLITPGSRRLTTMRLELGSHEGGSAGGPDVDINGIWYP